MGDLSEHFSRREFACKCGCGFDDVNPELVDKLDEIRVVLGKPVSINSGCRCEKYNEKVGGKKSSAHLAGAAADIRCGSSGKRYGLLFYLMAKFGRVGIGKNFIHVDVDPEKPVNVAWVY